MLTVVPGAADADDPRRPDGVALIDEIVREGARRMLAEALQAEVDDYIAQFADERDDNGRRWWCATAPTSPARSSPARARSRWSRRGSTTAAPTRTPASAPVLLGDPAALVPQDPEDHRSAAAAVPARPLVRGLRARARAVPRLDRRPVRAGDHQADRDLEDRATHLRRPRPVGRGLRLPVGRRDPRQHPPAGAQAVPARAHRRARRRAQGARRPGRRVPGVDRVLGGPVA